MKNVFSPFSAIVLCAMLLYPVSGQAKELTVSAAASLTDAFTQIKTEFEKNNPEVTIHTNFAASNSLLKQIQTGAPVDVFASADQATMDSAAATEAILSNTRKNFAENALVLIVPGGAKQKPASVQDLLHTEYTRIAVGNPASVPAGRYAQESLENQHLWNKLTDRFIMSESVRQVLDYVSRDEVDAGFVYTTDACKAKNNVLIALTMTSHTPVAYPIAVVQGSPQAELARQFIAYVLSEEDQHILSTFGFKPPRE